MCHKQAGNRSVPKCARAKKQTASELQHEQSARWLESLKNSRPTLRCTADSADMLANLSIQPLSKATRTLATGDNNHISTYIKNHQDTATDLRLKTTRADWINSRTTGHTWITWRHWPSGAGGQTEASLLERLARKSTVEYCGDSSTCCQRGWAPGLVLRIYLCQIAHQEFAHVNTRIQPKS